MDLQDHYTHMWNEALEKFENSVFEYDPLIESDKDSRRGITLLARPSAETIGKVLPVLEELRQLEPEQYYYPAHDLHITVMSIISCYEGFTLDAIDTQSYIRRIREITGEYPSFAIRFSGITASAGCILLQGFPQDDNLNRLRDSVRNSFKNSGLQHSIDKRYRISTAHCTLIRFKNKIQNPGRFIAKLKEFRDYFFGSSGVNELELVYNDWYQRKGKSLLLEKYNLTASSFRKSVNKM